MSETNVEFSNIREAKGDLYIAVFDRKEAFLKPEQAFMKKIVPVRQTGNLTVSLGAMPAGYYAISCFQDLNGNGKLDTNFLGIPSEPYGFSNNARPKFRAPYWAESLFWADGSGTGVRLETW